jgi:integrase
MNVMGTDLELLMLRCGLHVSEVVDLRGSDLDWEQQALRIDQGKGARIVYGQVALQAEKQKAPSVSGGLT